MKTSARPGGPGGVLTVMDQQGFLVLTNTPHSQQGEVGEG